MKVLLIKNNTVMQIRNIKSLSDNFIKKYRDYDIMTNANLMVGAVINKEVNRVVENIHDNEWHELGLILNLGLGDSLQLRYVLNSIDCSNLHLFINSEHRILFDGLDIILHDLSEVSKYSFNNLINLNNIIIDNIDKPRIPLLRSILKIETELDLSFPYASNHIEENTIGCQLSAGATFREYPVDKWLDIFTHLPNLTFLLFSDKEIPVPSLPNNCVNLTGILSLESFFEYFSSCKVIVTPDSFSMHLATVYSKPCIVLAGSTIPDISCYPDIYTVIYGDSECRECWDKKVKYVKCPEVSCMDSISTEQIVETIKRNI